MMTSGGQLLCVLALCHLGLAQLSGTVLPDANLCGKRVMRFKRLINGSDSNAEFPWTAAIGYTTPGRPKPVWLCSGSLVTDRHILTAAVCAAGAPRGYIITTVRLGEVDLDDSVQDNATPVDYELANVLLHPQYNQRTQANNIAILTLKNRVTYSKFIRPICLPTEVAFRSKNFTGHFADIVGWGRTELGGKLPSRLKKATMRVWDQQKCKEIYELKRRVIDDKMVCAGGDSKHVCYGDQGGPLMVRYSPAGRGTLVNHFLLGIVSHGYQCGTTGFPGVFTRVAEFMDWILQNLN